MIEIYDKHTYLSGATKFVKVPWGSFIEFPGGELHCSIKNLPAECHILARIRSWQDMGELLTITNAIKNAHKTMDQPTELHLFIPYFPGARQDRIANWGEPFTLKMYADLINAQGYDSVTIVDPHSDTCTALIDNVKVFDIAPILRNLVDKEGYDTIIIPDAGAAKKTFSYYFPDTTGLTFVQCLKKRNTETGKLSGFQVAGYSPIGNGAKCLLVDDICDGGGTFIGLADEISEENSEFRKNNPGLHHIEKLSLFVTHGIFSKGIGCLDVFDNVYTTDSFYTKQEYNEQYPGIEAQPSYLSIIHEFFHVYYR